MNALRCLRVLARPAVGATTPSTLLRPSIGRVAAPQTARHLSLLSPHRPSLPSASHQTLPSPSTPSTTASLSPGTLDLLPKPSSHPGLASIQIRCGPRDTFNPSHLVRKRRHGWLSRIRTKKGRKLLMRRIKKGRWNLSH